MLNTLQKLLTRAAVAAVAWGASCAAWALLPIEHWTQDSGAQVWLISSPGIPMLGMQVQFPGGLLHEPGDRQGLHAVYLMMAAQGVQAQGEKPALDENALGQAWADLGASFDAIWDWKSTGYLFRSLTEPDLLGQAIDLAARQMAQPVWPQDVWQREQARAIASLKEKDTRAGKLATKTFERALYGSHPYGHRPTPESLARIEVADIAAFHQRTVVACRARVALVGAIDRAQADALVQRLLAPLQQRQSPGGCAPLPSVPAVQPLRTSQQHDIAFDAAQAQVLIGQPVDIARTSEHYLAALVGNHILGGGGFTSRLTEAVREKRGLSYSVYSRFSPAEEAAAFSIRLQTRPDQAGAALEVVQQTLRRFIAEGPSAQELQAAKDHLTGSFALRIDSNDKLLGNLAMIAMHGLPLDYLERWSEKIQALTLAQVQAAMQRMVQPERMVTVVLGATPRTKPGETTDKAPAPRATPAASTN